MEKFLFEIPVEVALERIRMSQSRKFSYLYKGEMKEICITDTAKVVAKSPKCCFCGAEATRAFIVENEEKLGVRFYTEKNGQLVLFTKDHKNPKAKGGKDVFKNYQTACQRCNMLKSDISKNNEVSKAVVELREKVLSQRKEIKDLHKRADRLQVERNLLEEELYEIYSLKIVQIYFKLKKLFSKIIDKTKRV